MPPFKELTLARIRDGIQKKEFTATDVVKVFLTHINETDKKIGAYLFVNEAGALAQAADIDARIAQGKVFGNLAGVPIAIKDNILISGIQATAGSKILNGYTASYDATVIRKLREAGAIFLGKTNLDEFAMGSSTENSALQITRNPHDLSRVPGGSSGGSAAAVAAHLAPVALGSDTGGSIRQPASFCGVVGMKPTYGTVSRYGAVALASSLDQIGPFAHTTEDAGLLFETIRGSDPYDSTVIPGDYPVVSRLPDTADLKHFTIGIPKEYFVEGLAPEVAEAVQHAIDQFKSLGIQVKEVSLPHTKYALSTYYIVMPAEASANLARYDGIRYARREPGDSLLDLYLKNRGLGFGPEPKRRIILGTFVLSSGYHDAYYTKAQKVRTLIARDFEAAFAEVDVLLTPTAPTVAFKFGEKIADPLAMYLSDIYTIPANLAGLPAISMPVHAVSAGTEGQSLPIGFQLMGKHFREKDLIDLGRWYEKIRT